MTTSYELDCTLIMNTSDGQTLIVVTDLLDGTFVMTTIDRNDVGQSFRINGFENIIEKVGVKEFVENCSNKSYARMFPNLLNYEGEIFQPTFFPVAIHVIESWCGDVANQREQYDGKIPESLKVGKLWEIQFNFLTKIIECDIYDTNGVDLIIPIPFDYIDKSELKPILDRIRVCKPGVQDIVRFRAAYPELQDYEYDEVKSVSIGRLNKNGRLVFRDNDIRIHEFFNEKLKGSC